MQKHIQHNKDEWRHFFRKIYLSLYWKGSKGFTVWEVSWRLNRTATYWPPTLMAITAFLSRSPGLLNQGPGGPASLGHGPHSSIFSPTATTQLGAPSAGCCFSLQHLIFNWLVLPVHRVILLFYAHSIQPVDNQGYPLDAFDQMHLLFTQVHFLFWQLSRGQYATLCL